MKKKSIQLTKALKNYAKENNEVLSHTLEKFKKKRN